MAVCSYLKLSIKLATPQFFMPNAELGAIAEGLAAALAGGFTKVVLESDC